MNLLAKRPNVLFSVFVRNENVELVYLTQLHRDVYYHKLIASLTVMTHNNALQSWHVKRRMHRDGGPAYITIGCKMWYKHGRVHRDDGPALEYSNGSYEWRLNGLQHRDGLLPSSMTIRGDDIYHQWYRHGDLHRDLIVDGELQPAITRTRNGIVDIKHWYIDGYPPNDHPAFWKNGSYFWKNDGQHQSEEETLAMFNKYKARLDWYENNRAKNDDPSFKN